MASEAAEPYVLATRWAPWGLAALLLYVISAVVAGWRYFPGFSGDSAWYLQVALRVSQGETLYRDVAWAYGPLPAQVLAAFFRWGGPDVAWASLINGLLTVAGVLLTYTVTRGLLAPGRALLTTAFTTVAGASPWYSLFHTHYYVYTQAIPWGGVASLAALAVMLRWQRTRHSAWLGLAGLATGLAVLSKPEFGLVALASSIAALICARARTGAWWRFLFTCILTVALGFGVQAVSAGVWHVWRGYIGYDQLFGGSTKLWGTRLGDRRLLLGGYAFWLVLAAVWAGHRWPRWRWVFGLLALAGAAAVTAVGLSYLLGITDTMLVALARRGDVSGITVMPANVLNMVSLPWAALLPLLLGAGWLAHGRALPSAWWVLWTYAITSSLRFFFSGYANAYAIAPAIAVLLVWMDDRLSASQDKLRDGRRVALGILAGLAIVNVAAQLVIPNPLLNGPRSWLDTALGRVRVPQIYQAEYIALTAYINQQIPAGAPIFTTGWGAQWYLLTRHPNPTAFDAWFVGLGTSGPEASDLERDLLASPPAAVIMPNTWRLDADGLSRDARDPRRTVPTWWQSLQQDYVNQTPAEAQHWRILLRRPKSSP